jgi:hypothetical protein
MGEACGNHEMCEMHRNISLTNLEGRDNFDDLGVTTLVNRLDYIATKVWMTINNKLGNMGKEAAVAIFMVLPRNLLVGTEKSEKKLREDNRFAGQCFNRASSGRK